MRKILSVLPVFVFVVLAMATLAEAQSRSPMVNVISRSAAGGGYRGGYDRNVRGYYSGYYDPATIQQMMSLPNGLLACEVDFSTVRVLGCRPIAKTVMAINAFGQNHDRSELLGTVHVEKGKFHFNSFDDTNFRIGTGMGGTLGAGGGAAIGGATGGRKGAAIGAVGGAIVGGILGSHKSHNNCLVIEPAMAQMVTQNSVLPQVVQQTVDASVSTSHGEGQFELSNSTRVYVEAYDGETYIGRIAPGATLSVGPPKDRYRGFAQVPQPDGRLAKDELSREVSPSGWTFIEPASAQGVK